MDDDSNLRLFVNEDWFDNDSLNSVSLIIDTSPIESSTSSSLTNVTHQSTSSSNEPTIGDQLCQLMSLFKVQDELCKRLYLLENSKIIIVCDDSGSMNTTVDDTTRSRWDELCSIVKIILSISTIFHSNGVDIYFLNRGSFLDVINPQSIDKIFSIRPRGYTPLVPVLRHIFQLSSYCRNDEKKTLVFVATDGAPTDEKGNENLIEFEHLMAEERQSDTTHVMFLLCTDDQDSVKYLNEWDTNMINVDVTDDYKSERDKIRYFRGENYPFSIGDYVIKALLGAIDPQIDSLNESDQIISY